MLEIKNKDILNYELSFDNYDGNSCLVTLFLKRRIGLKDEIIKYASDGKFIKIKYARFILSGTVVYLQTSFSSNTNDVLPVIMLSLKDAKVEYE